MAIFSQEKRRFSIDSTSQQQEICSKSPALIPKGKTNLDLFSTL
jgi:hypothetical protein